MAAFIYLVVFVFSIILMFSDGAIAGVILLGVSSVIYFIIAMSDDFSKNEENAQKKIAFTNKMREDGFMADSVANFIPGNISFQVDYDSKRIAICNFNYETASYYDIDKIVSFEVIQNNQMIMQGGVGRAIVGGAIAGSTGALVGAMTRKNNNILKRTYIKIVMNDKEKPCVKIPILPYTGVESYGNPSPCVNEIDIVENEGLYTQIQNFIDECMAILTYIVNNKNEILSNKTIDKNVTTEYNLDEIAKEVGANSIAIINKLKEQTDLSLDEIVDIVENYMKLHGLE